MRLILDTHIVLAIALRRLESVSPTIARAVAREDVRLWASAASFWEIAIKARLGKLDPGMPLEALPAYIEAAGTTILPVTAAHAIAPVEPLPPTRDPFDRLLLGQCRVEDYRLATLDRALIDHPLAARFVDGPRG